MGCSLSYLFIQTEAELKCIEKKISGIDQKEKDYLRKICSVSQRSGDFFQDSWTGMKKSDNRQTKR